MQEVFPIDIFNAKFTPITVVPNSSFSRKVIQIVDPEFSSVCPKTGLPDYGRVILQYIPGKSCVELKDWKLYLRCYYGVGCFHENVTQKIADDFSDAVHPRWMRITIDWGARGGLHTTTQLTKKGGKYITSEKDWLSDVFVKHALSWSNS